MAFGRERFLIPGFIRSPPTLDIYDVAHCLPLGGAGKGFPFTVDKTRRHFSYLSGTFRKRINVKNLNLHINVGLSGLGVTCSLRDPKFAGSNSAEVDGFFQGVKILSTSPPGGTLSWGSRV